MTQKILLAFLIIILALPVNAEDFTAGDVVVVFKSDEKVSSSLSTNFAGASLKKTYHELSKTGKEIFALIHSDDADPEQLAHELLKNPNVVAASPNYIVRAASTPNDTWMSYLWGFEDINMPSAWDKETGSDDVYVAIIDSGIDWTNPDLSDNVASDLGFNAINTSRSALDDGGHGTHVAGTIGAIGNNDKGIAGVNWNVKMIPVKVLDSEGYGTVETVIAGINHIAGLMSNDYNIRALNLSLETYSTLKPEHDYLVNNPLWRAFKVIDEYNRAVIVVAAGNNETAVGRETTRTRRDSDGRTVFVPGCYVYPASYVGLNNMLSVSATNRSGNLSTYSNTNADISAPGGDYNGDGSMIISTWLQSSIINMTYEGISLYAAQGTSMAAPHVAGAAALLAAHDPNMTAYQIKQCILNTKATGGEGLLDVAAALNYQENYGNAISYEGTEAEGYEDWGNYTVDNNINTNGNDNNNDYNNHNLSDWYRDVSSGGCNGLLLNVFAVLLIFPLAKKFIN